MWGRKETSEPAPADGNEVAPLKDAMREARIENAERSGVVVDLRDAELARLELLNESLEPLFAEIPEGIELFDRGISRGDVPRLWIDVVAHVEMGRDKRIYRFVQDTRYGRKVLAESYEVSDLVTAVTRYVARRMVERERALADNGGRNNILGEARFERRRRRSGIWKAFFLGLIVGIGALVVLALMSPAP